MFLDLSTDLLEAINKELDSSDQARLRAVCRELDGASRHVFFSRLVLRTGEHISGLRRGESDLELLRALAAGKTGWNAHVRKIDFVPGPYVGPERKKKLSFLRLGKEKKRQARQREVEVLFQSALSKVMNVRAISWKVAQYEDPLWQREAIANFISRAPALEEFGLDMIHISLDSFPVPSARGLRKLDLTVYPWPRSDDNAGQYNSITQLIAAQEHLTCLVLNGPVQWTELWVALREAQIHLAEITTTIVSPDLFKYLLSYTGLRKLDLGCQDAGSQAGNDRLADTFHETVLPHHADSLVELSCPGRYESRFSFGAHNMHVISQLPQLTSLAMSLNSAARESTYSQSSESLVYTEIEPTSVNLLLDTASNLPTLRNLTIHAADSDRFRNMCCCGYDSVRNLRELQKTSITRSLREFRCAGENRLEVHVGEEVYGLRLVDSVGVCQGGTFYEYYLKSKIPSLESCC
ncbi:hypothetical protein FB45DRAFT_1063982 [Roridomyces roridus]|uniref:F-box domain-containing protein n=1 Tax=Roridomyces roridus TaxID=1738132 RepID=A0AAD7BC79_9AGAR|nr:hypothetical protein FB45DRAFT_1063982 [Roridomyces roridus]